MTIKELNELRSRLWAVISRPDGISMNRHSKNMGIAASTFRNFIEGRSVPHSHIINKIVAYLDTMKG